MKRIWILLVISLLGLGLFTACASNADTMPSPNPSTSPMASPDATATDMPAVSPSTSPTVAVTINPTTSAEPAFGEGVNTVEDALRVSNQVSEEVEKLSELTSAEAVVAGNIAVVGVKYDTQYQGGLTDRLTEMVQARVEAIDKSITTVQVKDDQETYKKLTELREKLSKQGVSFEELQTQLLELASSQTTQSGTAQQS